MRLSGALLAALSATAWGYEIPALPARVALSGDGPACSSPALRGALEDRFMRVVGPGEPADLRVACSEDSENLILDVRTRIGGARFRVERTPSSTERGTAYLAVDGVTHDSEIVDAALDAFLARNASLAAAGDQDFAASDWSGAVQRLSAGLESDLNPAPIYFGLYRAHAALGRPVKAKWFLEAYLRASGTAPSALTREQALPLIQAEASGADDAADADGLFARYRELAAAHRWDAALRQLRDVVAQAPWYVPAYVSLAESCDRVGWKRLAKAWRARAAFARGVDGDSRLGRGIEARLDSVR